MLFQPTVMYDSGQGVTKDRISAYMWYNLAAAQGLDGAATKRDGVFLYDEDKSKSQKLAKGCLARNYKGC
jgi:hypothetical protein